MENDPNEKHAKYRAGVSNQRRVVVCILFMLVLIVVHTFIPQCPEQELRHRSVPLSRPILSNSSSFDSGASKIDAIDETFKIDLKALQSHFSPLMFDDSVQSLKVDAVKHSNLVQKNVALLDHYAAHSNLFDTFTSLSLASTSLTQLTYLNHSAMDVARFTALVHPWSKQTSNTLLSSFKCRGIVITTGDAHVQFAIVLVHSLRHTLKCTLPIQIAHAGPEDLSPDNLALLTRYSNVEAFNMRNKMHGSVQGWYWKPFAILFSSFVEVIFLDADSLVLVDPNIFFTHDNYVKYGFLIYRDRRVKILRNVHVQLKDALGDVSDTLRNSGLFMDETNQEAESGVVVYDKARRGVLGALMTTCSLNWDKMLAVVDTFFHGEKETFWLGFELIGVPYRFVNSYGATVGERVAEDVVCGALSHSDDQGNLIWFNGGLSVSKSSEFIDNILNFDHYTLDDQRNVQGVWSFSYDYSLFCWQSKFPRQQIKKLSREQKEMIKEFVVTYKLVRGGKYNELL